MKDTISVDNQGRILIPKAYRLANSITDLSIFRYSIQDNSIILTPSNHKGYDPNYMIEGLHNLRSMLVGIKDNQRQQLDMIIDLFRKYDDLKHQGSEDPGDRVQEIQETGSRGSGPGDHEIQDPTVKIQDAK